MESQEESSFDKALESYKSGADLNEVLNDFEDIVNSAPNNSAGWTCLSWLQLLCNQPINALKSARIAVKLNSQDPQARINLSLSLLETNSKGVREHIDFVKRALFIVPELENEIKNSLEDGLRRKPDWRSLQKVQKWLDI
tara:strand:- start:4104 stop:4523 length:420 start_codon:yes stop_codon:yes gene_type:complete